MTSAMPHPWRIVDHSPPVFQLVLQGSHATPCTAHPCYTESHCHSVKHSPLFAPPPVQSGAKLHYVSDLFLLGWATIYESLSLLHWLQAQVRERGAAEEH